MRKLLWCLLMMGLAASVASAQVKCQKCQRDGCSDYTYDGGVCNCSWDPDLLQCSYCGACTFDGTNRHCGNCGQIKTGGNPHPWLQAKPLPDDLQPHSPAAARIVKGLQKLYTNKPFCNREGKTWMSANDDVPVEWTYHSEDDSGTLRGRLVISYPLTKVEDVLTFGDGTWKLTTGPGKDGPVIEGRF
jgi:hypothetical protein